ncbi:DUF4224 domain-containing protein (plasmid) [Herbaspirillum seropedicae]|uniref:DUF4224 domain-containing protein n=1 Tax=Herbaspirillum seropedicae TaxID=964 RepID=UPI00112038BB|nr:DUF4224 domain-containing protein [Herbaspirillum seropedicae]QDD62683.1 DUF4224 domain-containing protein [Herbaspirillum seropedicae]
MQAIAQPITLTEEEVVAITGYHRAAFQLRRLEEMGIPAHRRPDNTVMVLRVYATTRPAAEAAPEKQEPKLRLIRK